jgi:ornithine decarboxylase
LQNAVERIQIWRNTLPRVELFYAAKTNPDLEICKKAHEMGTGFDVASIQEMKDIMSLGVNPEDLIFANPIK